MKGQLFTMHARRKQRTCNLLQVTPCVRVECINGSWGLF